MSASFGVYVVMLQEGLRIVGGGGTDMISKDSRRIQAD